MRLRVVLSALSVVVAAALGVVTNAFSSGWEWPWGIALSALVVLLIGVQLGLALLDRGPSGQQGESPPSVTVTGDRSVGTVTGGTVVTGDSNVVAPLLEKADDGVVGPPRERRR
ncbi:hypothetical protein [Micromonospora saelicesensis]|uniref:hypothetical protein n=1 Tax=Micromonospora saelicesensis TaxID=285676 RepID=UPI003CE9D250